MCRSNHGVAADYFAVGVIAYECMMGKVFSGLYKNRIIEAISRKIS